MPVLLSVLAVGQPSSLGGAEMGPLLQFEPLQGDIGFRYDLNSTTAGSSAGSSTNQFGFSYEELNVRQRISVYHPRFLVLDWGAGLSLTQGHGDAAERTAELTRYRARAGFLQQHPYSLVLYADKSAADYVHTPTDVSQQERRNVGATLDLKDNLGLPMPLSVNARRSSSEALEVFADLSQGAASSQRRITADRTDDLTVSSQKNWSNVALDWRYSRQDVEQEQDTAGGPLLIAYRREQVNAGLNGHAGENERLRWRMRFNGLQQTGDPVYEQRDASGDVRLKLVDNFYTTLESVVGGSVAENRHEPTLGPTQRTETQRVHAGLEHRLFQSLHTRLQLSQGRTEYPDFRNTSRSALLAVQYAKRTTDGRVSASYSLERGADRNEGSEIVTVLDEPYVLNDFTPVVLVAENVLLSEPYLVTDQTGTLIYVENVDYRIYQVGTLTYLERLSGTSILNGETVLVDYSFSAARRTMQFRTQSFGFQMRWRYVEPYARLVQRDQWISEGSSDAYLNPGRQTVLGTRVHGKLWQESRGEFSIEAETNSQVLDPYDQFKLDGAVDFSLAEGTDSRVYLSHTAADHDADDRDSDRTRLGARLTYHRGRYRASVEGNTESSGLGTSERRATVIKSEGELRYGRWVLSAILRIAWESYRAAPSEDGFHGRSYALQTGMRRTF